jgi:hypothetical protein
LPVDADLARGRTPRVSLSKARRAEKTFLREWDETRPRRRPRHLGADEIHRGKVQKFYTVLSDLVRGEVLGLAADRTEESLTGLLTTCLTGGSARPSKPSARTCISPI